MSNAILGFRWLDILEQEFDKAFVELDSIMVDVDDEDYVDIIEMARKKMTTLSSAFSQLVHKSQTIFQNNAKLEAQIVDMREELCQLKSSIILQEHKTVEPRADWSVRCTQYENENKKLHEHLLALQGEVYGARLAAKYLDKELAGRIQQLQLLSRENMKPEAQKKLWNQLESEIFLHRHKTVVRACQGRDKSLAGPTSSDPSVHIQPHLPIAGESRQVTLIRPQDAGLGLSVTGGEEHGVPILISRVHAESVAAQSQNVFVGDAILSVNNLDLRHSRHNDAVKILSEQKGQVHLELLFLPPGKEGDEDPQLESDSTLRYPVYSEEIGIPANNWPDTTETTQTIHEVSDQQIPSKSSSDPVRVGNITTATIQSHTDDEHSQTHVFHSDS